MWIFKEHAEENRRINSVKEDTERADGTVRIVMSAPFFEFSLVIYAGYIIINYVYFYV